MSKKPWEKSVGEYCYFLETVTLDPDAGLDPDALAGYIHKKMEDAFNAGREYHSVRYELSGSEIFDLQSEGIKYNPNKHYDTRTVRKYEDYRDYKTKNKL